MSDNPSISNMPSRTSHSKRHASFNSPREVPLPSPSLSITESVSSFFLPPPPSPPRSPVAHRHQDDTEMTHRQQKSPVPFPSSQESNPQESLTIPEPSHSQSGWEDRFSSASLPLPSQIPFHTLSNPPHRPLNNRSSFSLNFQPESSTPAPSQSPPSPSKMKHEDSSSSSSSSSSNSRDSVSTTNSSVVANVTPPAAAEKPQVTQSESRPISRPVSPFRAPQPPPYQSRAPAHFEGTAMRRFMTATQLQGMSMASNSPSTSDSPYPPPEPPTILPVDPTPYDSASSLMGSHRAPYLPFLSHVLPAPDTFWIEVETSPSEYRLIVRLPGFSREGITLATKRRKILHIVADSWENGGGHFERKISFGYDADLGQVRAEFDGAILRISIPRRVSPVTWSGSSARLGTSARV